jgi:hypothetical protein
MTAEQEDIDYYNQIQAERAAYAAGTGGRSDAMILQDKYFRANIAWWPKGMRTKEKDYGGYQYYSNLRSVGSITLPLNSETFMSSCFNFNDVGSLNFEDVEILNSAFSYSGIRNFHQTLPKAKSMNNMFQMSSIFECDIVAPAVITATNCYINCKNLIRAHLVMLNLNNASTMFQQSTIKELILEGQPTNMAAMFAYCYEIITVDVDLSLVNEAKNANAMFTGVNTLESAFIKGLQVDLMIEKANKLQLSSVKYILDNCQAREDGASYTLTLHANVKAAFMAKCTEGDENYDAEYAATLAAANAKGLTIA